MILALLLAQTAAKAPPATSADAAANPVIWSGAVTLGLIALTGNSQTLTFSTTGALERKSPDWIVGVKTSAAYGNNTAAGAGSSTVAPRLGAFYRYAFSKDVIFSEDASALENLAGTARSLLASTTRLSSRLVERIALGVGFAVNYDSAPPPTRVSTDTALTVSLEIGL